MITSCLLIALCCLLNTSYVFAVPAPIPANDVTAYGNTSVAAKFIPTERIPMILKIQAPFLYLRAVTTGHLLLYTIDTLWRMGQDERPTAITDRLVGMTTTFISGPGQEALKTATIMGWATMTLLEFFFDSSTESTYEWKVGTAYFVPEEGGSAFALAKITRTNNAIGDSANSSVEAPAKRSAGVNIAVTVPAATYLGFANDFDIVYGIVHRPNSMATFSMMDLAYQFLAHQVWPKGPDQTIGPTFPDGHQLIVGPNRFGDFMNIEFTRSSFLYQGQVVFIDWGLVARALISVLADGSIEGMNFGVGFIAPIMLRRPGSDGLSDVVMTIVMASTRFGAMNPLAKNGTAVLEMVASS